MFAMEEENDHFIFADEDAHIYETENEASAWQSENDSEMEEVECALYAQIHFQEEDGSLSENAFYDIEVFSDNLGKEINFCGSTNKNLSLVQSDIQRPINEILSRKKSKVSFDKVKKTKRSKDPYSSDCIKADTSKKTTSSNKRSKVTVSFDKVKKTKRSKDPCSSDCNKADTNTTVKDTDSSSDMEMAFDDDVNNWLVVDDDKPELTIHMQSTRKPFQRYHEPLSVTCFNCRQRGHMSHVCPKPQKSVICIHCGITGHNWRTCSDVACFNCEQFGHIAKDCQHPRKNSYVKCFRCYMFGHSKNLCPDEWRQFHMTVSLPLRSQKVLKNPNVWCYNCASRGHFGYQCSQERFTRHTSFTYPFIAQYRSYIDANYCARNEKHSSIKNEDLSSKSSKKKLEQKTIEKKPTMLVEEEKIKIITKKKKKPKMLVEEEKIKIIMKKKKKTKMLVEEEKIKIIMKKKKKTKMAKVEKEDIEQIVGEKVKNRKKSGSKSKKDIKENGTSKNLDKFVKLKKKCKNSDHEGKKRVGKCKDLTVDLDCKKMKGKEVEKLVSLQHTDSKKKKESVAAEKVVTKKTGGNFRCEKNQSCHNENKNQKVKENVEGKNSIDLTFESDVIDLTIQSSGEDKRTKNRFNVNVDLKKQKCMNNLLQDLGSLDNPICLLSQSDKADSKKKLKGECQDSHPKTKKSRKICEEKRQKKSRKILPEEKQNVQCHTKTKNVNKMKNKKETSQQ